MVCRIGSSFFGGHLGRSKQSHPTTRLVATNLRNGSPLSDQLVGLLHSLACATWRVRFEVLPERFILPGALNPEVESHTPVWESCLLFLH